MCPEIAAGLCANPRPSTAPSSPPSSAPPRPASTTSAAGAPSAPSRTSTTCSSSARACRATRWRATASAATPTSSSATGTPLVPLHLDIPVTIAGMSFGALSAQAKEALGRGASEAGHLHDDRRRRHDAGGARASPRPRLPVPAQPLRHEPRRPPRRRRDRDRPRAGRQARRRRHAARPEDQRAGRGDADAARRASTSAAPAATPTGPAPTTSPSRSSSCARSPTGEKPVYVKIGATRTYYDVKLAVDAGADVVVVDGMQGGTAATQEVFIEHVGIPTLAAIPQAVQALQELGLHRKVQLIVSGGIRTGADVAKAMALGADAVVDRDGRADRAGRQRAAVRRRVPRAGHAPPASTTTSRTAAIPPGSRPRTRSWPRASTRSRAAAAWPTTCGC